MSTPKDLEPEALAAALAEHVKETEAGALEQVERRLAVLEACRQELALHWENVHRLIELNKAHHAVMQSANEAMVRWTAGIAQYGALVEEYDKEIGAELIAVQAQLDAIQGAQPPAKRPPLVTMIPAGELPQQ